MKLSWRDIEGFVKSPSKDARAVLVYGPDDGLMRERAAIIARSVAPDLNDPFAVAVLSGDTVADDPARLAAEADAIPMFGGGRLVRVTGAADKITTAVKLYLDNPNPQALVVIEAGELGPRSPLRILCEKSPHAVALPCYVEDARDLAKFIRAELQAQNINATPDAVSWLSVAIAGDRLRARREIEKLVLYKGAGATPLTLEDAQACCGTGGAESFDDLVFSVGGRDAAKALKIYDRMLGEGVAFIALIRALQNHFRRLHFARARMETGLSADEAASALQPPVFFKQKDAFTAQLRQWPQATLEKILVRLMDVEAQCKRTGMPAETLCAQALLGIASMK